MRSTSIALSGSSDSSDATQTASLSKNQRAEVSNRHRSSFRFAIPVKS